MKIAVDNVSNHLTMPERAKSIVVDLDGNKKELVEELLCHLGYATATCCRGINELYELDWSLYREGRHILVVYGEKVDGFLLSQTKDFLDAHSLPAILMTEDSSPESIKRAIQAGFNSYLVVGMQGNRIRQAIDSAIANYERIDELQKNLSSLQERFDQRVLIEKAKGIISKSKGMDEREAYQYLRRYSMTKGQKMHDVAKMILATAELLESD